MTILEEIKKTADVISESSSARREITRPKRDEYILNQKSKPMKVLIINNDATKKLCADWEKYGTKGDSNYKIKLDPTPNGYGGNGYYGVWESVKGKDDLYADVKRENGEMWIFTETHLSEAGAKKLLNNKMPLHSDFIKGDEVASDSYTSSRRKKSLKEREVNGKENVENVARNVAKASKEMWKDGADWSSDEHKKLEEIVDKGRRLYKNIEVGRQSRQRSKSDNVNYEKMINLMEIIKPLDKFRYSNDDEESKKEAKRIHDIYVNISNMQENKEQSKKIGDEISKLKQEVNNFLKKYDKKNSVKSKSFNY